MVDNMKEKKFRNMIKELGHCDKCINLKCLIIKA